MDCQPLHESESLQHSEPRRESEPSSSRANFAGFDFVRAFSALGVVLLHSCVPYLRHPMPGLAWPVRDTTSWWVDFGFWSIELFIMPLFLVLAGFLAWQTLRRRGRGALVRSRSSRLLKPLLFGALIVLPLDLYSWLLGWVVEGVVAPVKLRSLKFEGGVDRDLWGLSHLWFLQYLFLYVAVLAIFDAARDRYASLGQLRLPMRWTVATLLATGSAVVFWRPEVVWGFQHAFLPFASKWIYCGLFFALGVMLSVHDGQLTRLRAWAPRLIAPAALVTIAAVTLGQWHLAGGDDTLAQISLAILTSTGALLLTLSVVGMAVGKIERVPTAVSYLAAASFWVYLVHHPVLGLVHLDLKLMLPSASPIWKTAIAFGITGGLCLLLYEGLVRRSALGRWLGFAWQHDSPSVAADRDRRVILPINKGPAVHPQADQSDAETERKAA